MRKLISAACLTLAGVGAWAGPLYFLAPKPLPSAEVIACWAPHFKKFDEVVGYSVQGHFFMRSSKDQEYIVLHPFHRGAKAYGKFDSLAAFEASLLKEPGFESYVLQPEHVAAIEKVVGPVQWGEVYIPRPYPFLGGSGEPDTYSKGDVWVFMDIVGQFHDLCH